MMSTDHTTFVLYQICGLHDQRRASLSHTGSRYCRADRRCPEESSNQEPQNGRQQTSGDDNRRPRGCYDNTLFFLVINVPIESFSNNRLCAYFHIILNAVQVLECESQSTFAFVYVLILGYNSH